MITINIQKAKVIAHDKRRQFRADEFAPYDEAIAKQIPGRMEYAEAARVLIREKYAQMQIAIDAAQDVNALKTALNI